MNDVVIAQREEHVLSVNEVACVAEVPVKYVYRIIRSELLSDAVKRSEGRIAILSKGLVGFVGVKLAYDTGGILTLEGYMPKPTLFGAGGKDGRLGKSKGRLHQARSLSMRCLGPREILDR